MSATNLYPSITIDLPDEAATEALGRLLAKSLDDAMLIGLSGELGAGKTTLTRGFLRQCGHQAAVKSPTFTLVESYDFASASEQSVREDQRAGVLGLHHFDLYRVADPEELDFIGFEEYLEDDRDVIVEWPELGGDRVCELDFYVFLSHVGERRQARLEAHSLRARKWLENPLNENKFNYLKG